MKNPRTPSPLAEEIAAHALEGVRVPPSLAHLDNREIAHLTDKVVRQDRWGQSNRIWAAGINVVMVGLVLFEYITGELDIQLTLMLLGGIAGVALPLRSKLRDERAPRRRPFPKYE